VSLKIQPVMLRNLHSFGYRPGVWGTVLSVGMAKPVGRPSRPVFVVQFPDGVTDCVPISDAENYELRAFPLPDQQETL
jgi:hypothetical protein